MGKTRSRRGRNQGSSGRARERNLAYTAPQKAIKLDWAATLRFRFAPSVAGTPGNAVFSSNNLLTLVNVATNATTLKNLFSFVKLRAIRIYVSGLTQNGDSGEPFATLALQDVSSAAAGSGDVYQVSPIGLEVACIHVRPKPTQRWGQWLGPSDALSFAITNSDNQVLIELDLSYRAINGVNGITNAGVALTPGGCYFRGLDGNPLAATIYPIVCAIGDAA